jgi:RNA polymerase sigma-70 factor (ECF subfamily)
MLFALRFEEELTVRQIAEIMGVAEGTIKSRLHSLVLGLQTKMRKYAAEL